MECIPPPAWAYRHDGLMAWWADTDPHKNPKACPWRNPEGAK